MQEIRAEKTISAGAADRLIAAHDGDVALLYLYILKNGSFDEEQAAAALCRTLREIRAAEEKLRRMALLPLSDAPSSSPAQVQPLPPAEELPQYTAEDIARRAREDMTFSSVLAEAARVIGRNLSGNDTRVLFGIYDYLGLPAEVIFVLLHYCADQYEERYGSSRRPNARAIEKTAYEWARLELLTLEQAEDYAERQKLRRGTLGRIKGLLNIYGRELTASEEKYVSSWLDMGFHEDAITIAYDRTVTQTGSLKWPYMNKILLSWHEKGLHTAAEIEEKDGRRAAPRRGAAEVKPVDMDELRKIIDKI